MNKFKWLKAARKQTCNAYLCIISLSKTVYLHKLISMKRQKVLKVIPFLYLSDRAFPAANVFEYQWPQETGAEWYMLQEQISEFLAVKSFKRKYPGERQFRGKCPSCIVKNHALTVSMNSPLYILCFFFHLMGLSATW